MATSGVIYGSFSGKNYNDYHPYMTWSITQNILGNYSDVTVNLYFWKKLSSYYSYNLTGSSTSTSNIDGQTNYGRTDFDMRGTPLDYYVKTATARVYHNADGSRQCWIGWDGNCNTALGTYNFGQTVTFDTIPREAYITNSVNFQLGNSIPLTINNAGNMYLKLEFMAGATVGSYSGIGNRTLGQVTSYTLVPSSGEVNSMYALIPNQTSGAILVRIKTYTDASYTVQVGGDRDQVGTMSIDTAANAPTFTTYTASNLDKSIDVKDKYNNTLTTSSTSTLLGSDTKVIANYSKIRAVITTANKAVAKNSATMNKYRLTIGSQNVEASYSAGSTVNLDIDNVTSKDTSVSATDSRSLSTAVNVSLANLISYTELNIYGIILTRQNSVDAITTLGFSGTFWKQYFGGGSLGVLNTITAHYRYKLTTEAWGAQSWTSITPSSDGSGNITFNSAINGDLGANGFDTSKSFNVEVRVYDKLSAMIIEGVIPVGTPVMDVTKSGVAIKGKYDATEGGSFQVDGRSLYKSTVPIGGVIPYAARTAPNGFIVCEGAAISRTTYSLLFNAIVPSLGTVTLTIATPCVVTLNSHGLFWGDKVYFPSGGGDTLPTGLAFNTIYWVGYVDANTFKLCTSIANAQAGTYIATSGSQSGTHTLRHCPYGLGDGSTTFNVPDMRDRVWVGQNPNNGWEATAMGITGGEKYHTLTVAELAYHNHATSSDGAHNHLCGRREMDGADGGTQWTGIRPDGYSYDAQDVNIPSTNSAHNHAITYTGSNTAHNTMQPYTVGKYIIKF